MRCSMYLGSVSFGSRLASHHIAIDHLPIILDDNIVPQRPIRHPLCIRNIAVGSACARSIVRSRFTSRGDVPRSRILQSCFATSICSDVSQ